jgi:CRISPR/Cas system-associated endonuclease/helicase Cas3
MARMVVACVALIRIYKHTLVDIIYSFCCRCSVVVVDEVHERRIDTDLLLAFLKEIVESGKRPNFRVVVMSATLDVAALSAYFKVTEHAIFKKMKIRLAK